MIDIFIHCIVGAHLAPRKKLFNPDATDEELKAIDCYTEWYGQY